MTNQQYLNIKIGSVLQIILFLMSQSCHSAKLEANVEKIISRANVVYDSASFQTGYMHIPPYISNGVLGGCFDHMGFQSKPNKGVPNGRTVLGYIDQYYMHKPTTRQAQLPLAFIEAEFADGSTVYDMMDATEYRQELNIYRGILTTSYNLFGETQITAFAHQTIPNLFVLKIDRKADSPGKELVVKINCQTSETQKSLKWAPDPVKFDFQINGNSADIISSTNMVSTHWTISGNNPITIADDQLIIRLKEEENQILIRVHRSDVDDSETANLSYEELVARHIEAWAKNWQKCWIDFPTDRAQSVWTRANYYNISNFPVIPGKALIPTGMNSNIWGFTFPQDVYYVAENLLRSGQFERYEKSMEYWLDILPEVKKYSKRIMGVDGGFYPWTPPFNQWDEYEKNGVVGNDSYEIHNPAYVSAMVWHYYQYTDDLNFLKKYFPIMQEVWRFYSNVIHPNEHGTYDVNHDKAAGQDEASRLPSSKNLLCASYSAEYSARNYLKATALVQGAEEQLVGKANKVLSAGFERNSLMTDRGYYATYEGDNRPPNSQKHPVQLNAITFCPMSDLAFAAPSRTAWGKRYDLTVEAKKPISHGWTYAAFALASSRMGDPRELASDLSAAQYCAHADPRWIQFYEFTFWERYTLSTAYYFPTEGLYQQAYADAILQDWQGYMELFGCLLSDWRKHSITFKGLHTLNGISVDGNWNQGEIDITIHPNGAKSIPLKISSINGKLIAEGQQEGPRIFDAGEQINLVFNENKTIHITNKK